MCVLCVCLWWRGWDEACFSSKDFKLCGSGSDSGSENLEGCWCVCVV